MLEPARDPREHTLILRPEHVAKMDAGLQQLLPMEDRDIMEAVGRDRARLDERAREIDRLAEALPPDAPEVERRLVRRQQLQRRSRELVPDPVLVAIKGAAWTGSIVLAKIEALVRFCGNRDDLASLGLEVGASAQDIYVVTGDRFQLADLAAQPATVSLRLPRLVSPSLNNAGVQSQVFEAQKQYWSSSGYRGKGILVGVVDGPLDVTHNAFRRPNGDSRVLDYWVQKTDLEASQNTTPPGGKTPFDTNNSVFAADHFKHGCLYTGLEINAALVSKPTYGDAAGQISCSPYTDPKVGAVDPHGTYVTGVAAGSADPAMNRTGAAPEADIVYSAYRWDAPLESAILNGIDFLCRVAQWRDQPLVINLSLGWQLGPHDGTDEFSQFINNKMNSVPWLSVVVSAGNDNSSQCFRRGSVPAGSGTVETFDLTITSNPPAWVFLDIWYQGPQLEVQLEYFDKTYFPQGPSNWVAAGDASAGGIPASVTNETVGGKRRLTIKWPGKKWYVGPYVTSWVTVRLRNSDPYTPASYDAWVGLQGGNLRFVKPTLDMMTVSDTGCGQAGLTVGACYKLATADPEKGEPIALYSGAGPTADGRVKPEIVTVGGDVSDPILTAKPVEGKTDQYTDASDQVWGTSLAVPLVAGSVAQLFEALQEPSYWPPPPAPSKIYLPPDEVFQDDIKGILTTSAYRWDLDLNNAKQRNAYGFGRLRAFDAVKFFKPAPNVDVWIKTAVDDYGAEPYPGLYFSASPDIKVCRPQTEDEVTELVFDTETYDVRIIVRNLGLDQAHGITVKLYYSLPHTAPSEWKAAKVAYGPSSADSEDTVDYINPLGSSLAILKLCPRRYDFPQAPADWTHFCLLAIADTPADPMPNLSKSKDPWELYIKGHNNIALRNVKIIKPTP